MMGWLSGWWGGTAAVEPATPRDAAQLAQLHGASFHRGWGEGEFDAMLRERNTLAHRLRLGRKVIGFAVSRIAADEAEIGALAFNRHALDARLASETSTLFASLAVTGKPVGSFAVRQLEDIWQAVRHFFRHEEKATA